MKGVEQKGTVMRNIIKDIIDHLERNDFLRNPDAKRTKMPSTTTKLTFVCYMLRRVLCIPNDDGSVKTP